MTCIRKGEANLCAKEYHYPFRNSDDLAKVVQFLAMQRHIPWT
jgi:hypothetical protein